jgi:hypothetical protein
MGLPTRGGVAEPPIAVRAATPVSIHSELPHPPPPAPGSPPATYRPSAVIQAPARLPPPGLAPAPSAPHHRLAPRRRAARGDPTRPGCRRRPEPAIAFPARRSAWSSSAGPAPRSGDMAVLSCVRDALGEQRRIAASQPIASPHPSVVTPSPRRSARSGRAPGNGPAIHRRAPPGRAERLHNTRGGHVVLLDDKLRLLRDLLD